MIIDELRIALDAYALECEQVGRSAFMGTSARDARRAGINAIIAGVESALVVIRTRSGEDGTDSLDACHAIQDIVVAMIGNSDAPESTP